MEHPEEECHTVGENHSKHDDRKDFVGVTDTFWRDKEGDSVIVDVDSDVDSDGSVIVLNGSSGMPEPPTPAIFV